MSERRTTWLIFISLLLAYMYVFPHWLDWNQNTRFDLTAALVERGTLSIDGYVSNTGDYAEYQGRAYSDKAPGLSLLAVPVYAALRPLTSLEAVRSLIVVLGRNPSAAQTLNRPIDLISPGEWLLAARVILTTWLMLALPAAVFGAWLFRWLAQFDLAARSRALAVLAYGLATVSAPYSATLYGHQLAAIMLFVAWAELRCKPRRERPFIAGSLLGLAVITEYPAVLIAALIGLYAGVTLRKVRSISWLIIGGAWPLIGLGLYNTAIFGTPLALTYQYVANPRLNELVNTGFLSAGWPTLEAVWGLTFSPYRGLFFTSPVLLLAVIGAARIRRQRLDLVFSLICVVTFTLLVSGSAQWWGGWAAGPRYLIPVLPWLIWPLAAAIDRLTRSRPGTALTLLLIVASIVIVWSLSVGGQYYAPDDIANPLIDYSWPKIATGDVARNVGMLIGLPGTWSLLPLAGLIAGALWLAWRMNRLPHGGMAV